jgi:hypothetical protein
MRSVPLAALLAAAPFALPSQDAPEPGFSLSLAPYPTASPFAASTTLSSGEFVIFDGLEVVQFAPDGTPLRTLGSLDEFVFPSFVLADPDERLVFVGESSNGHVYKLFLGLSSAPDLLTTLPFNYDAALLSSAGPLYLSAAACGLVCGNELWRVDLGTGQATLVARVPGASGPIVFDRGGNLYYGSASALFPPPPKPSSVWRWSAQQLAGTTVLGLDDAQLVGGGFSGASRLAYDRRTSALYLMENNFASGENRIRRVLGSADESPVLVEGAPFRSMGNLDLRRGPGAARFRAYQPAEGGVLTYTSTDFAAPAERAEVRPRRPRALSSVPAPGVLRLELEHGPPNGFARIAYGLRALLPASERVFVLAGLPLFLGLDLASQGVVPGLFPLDAAGELRVDLSDPSGLASILALQLHLLDAQARPAGTSTVALL